jgi:hypothetical protein
MGLVAGVDDAAVATVVLAVAASAAIICIANNCAEGPVTAAGDLIGDAVDGISGLFDDDVPQQCIDEDIPPDRKDCEALKQSILNTCASLTGKKQFRCFAAANKAYRQCMGYE